MENIFYQFADIDNRVKQLAGSYIAVMLTAVLLCFLVSEITRNYSQVDKLWSLMPLIYSIMAMVVFPSPRLLVMTILVSAWGLRLSYNFSRKGGYNIIPWRGAEDYRWKIMQQQPALKGRVRFGLFNLFFISFYQHFLILLFSAPLLIAAGYSRTGLNLVDLAAGSLMLLFLIIETVADNQLFRFHTLKKQKIAATGFYSESLNKGFFSAGLWRFVRHPNFASEQAIWISFYFFSVAASGKWLNLTLAGALLLVLLFIGSSELTERISSDKYPGYKAYKKEVPRFIPRIFIRRK